MTSQPREMPLQERARERVSLVLGATKHILGESGYHGLTLSAICAHAQIKQTSIYRYWPNKQALVMSLASLFEQDYEKVFTELEKDGHRLSLDQLMRSPQTSHRQFRGPLRTIFRLPRLFGKGPESRESVANPAASSRRLRVEPWPQRGRGLAHSHRRIRAGVKRLSKPACDTVMSARRVMASGMACLFVLGLVMLSFEMVTSSRFYTELENVGGESHAH
jgi:AcrR family transcriptional regulator